VRICRKQASAMSAPRFCAILRARPFGGSSSSQPCARWSRPCVKWGPLVESIKVRRTTLPCEHSESLTRSPQGNQRSGAVSQGERRLCLLHRQSTWPTNGGRGEHMQQCFCAMNLEGECLLMTNGATRSLTSFRAVERAPFGDGPATHHL
jgi:hypothetical protein